ncbi:MAG: phosphoserine phosphatase SerB [Gammaproteobacteria bacterium]
MPEANPYPHALVLCADSLDQYVLQRVVDRLAASGARAAEPVWLSKGRAVDLPLMSMPEQPETLLAELDADLQATDMALVEQAKRRKKLLVSDMDSTIIQDETIDLLAAELGLGEQVAAITARAMHGEIDFRSALLERVGLLRGLSEHALGGLPAAATLTPGAKALVKTMRAHGAHTVLVSGGFDFMAEAIAPIVGFHETRANVLSVANGALTGDVVGDIVDADTKLSVLRARQAELGLGREQVLAIGDGANDLNMIEAAGMGVAFHAKPIVEQRAGYRIRYTDLRTALYFQGYRDSEIQD